MKQTLAERINFAILEKGINLMVAVDDLKAKLTKKTK